MLNKYTSAIIDKALREKELSKGKEKDVESPGRKLIFLDELIKDTSDKKRIRDLLLNALLGGRDTTMALLSHVFLNLSRNKTALKSCERRYPSSEGWRCHMNDSKTSNT